MVKKARGYKQQADLIGAMAHPTRLRILEILGESGECCVCHLTTILKQRQPYVSQQLMVLRNKGLVSDRKDGVMVYYRLVDPRVRDLIAMTRELLLKTDAAVAFAAIPRSPVPGCPCPVCEAASRHLSGEATSGHLSGE
jgi:DNA-binding transcriptional ArsR family regulator